MDSAFIDINHEIFGGDCKSGYRMCPENSAQTNTQYCIPKGEFGDKCPITAIHFKEKDDAGENSFEYSDFNEAYKIGVSRKIDSYPITEF